MRVNVAGLLKAPTGEMRRVEIDAPVDLEDEDVKVVAPVRGVVRLVRDHAGVLATGTLGTAVRVACARCLAPTVVEVEAEIEESYRPLVALPGGPPPVRPGEWEAATLIDEKNTLDLTEVARQSILLAVPLHPLCRPDCAGLCPQCGNDRNAIQCDCRPEPDPRWAELRAVLDDEP